MAELKLTEANPKYKQVSIIVDSWLEVHEGETFDLDIICRQIEAVTRDGRQMVAIKLNHEVKTGKLEKLNRIYRYIDNTIKKIDWLSSDENETYDFTWPWGHEDNSQFGFDGHVSLSPRDIIAIAGKSNAGKTTFCMNVLAENMDKHDCLLMGNEYSPAHFKRQMNKMNWVNPLKEDGTPKFELVERFDNWKDIIRPDGLNIIDWITVPDAEFYKMDGIFRGIQQKLNKGIAVIAIQKGEGDLGEGGEKSIRVPRVYLSMNFDRLKVVKAKDWNGFNPNNKEYGFTIVNGGTKFHNIRPIKKCHCWGKNPKCDECLGTGYVDE